MKELWKIYRLQAYEKEISCLKDQVKILDPGQELETRKTGLFNIYNNSKTKLEENKKRIKEINFESSEMDKQLHNIETKLYKGQLSSKESAQWQKELNNIKKKREILDEEVLTLMYENETIEGELEVSQKEFQKIEEEYKAFYSVYEEKLNELQSKIDEAESKWEKIKETTPDELLTVFEDLKAKHDGIAIVSLQRNICGGCGMTLSGMIFEKAKSKMDLTLCEHCGRILYWEGGAQSGSI